MSTTVVDFRNSEWDERVDSSSHSVFGNPFYKFDHKNPKARMVSIWRYLTEYLLEKPDILQKIPTLKDKRLGCWCYPNPCHGDILAYFADNPDKLTEAIQKKKPKQEMATEIFNFFKWCIPAGCISPENSSKNKTIQTKLILEIEQLQRREA